MQVVQSNPELFTPINHYLLNEFSVYIVCDKVALYVSSSGQKTSTKI